MHKHNEVHGHASPIKMKQLTCTKDAPPIKCSESGASSQKFSQSARPERTPPRARSQCSLYYIISHCVFCAARRPATLPTESPLRRQPPRSTANNIFYHFRSNHEKPNGANEVICSETRALAFPLQGTANPDGPGTTGIGGCSSPIPGVARPPSIIPYSILRTPFASIHVYLPPSSGKPAGRPASSIVRLENNRRQLDTCAAVDNCTVECLRPYVRIESPCPPGAGGSGPKKQITFKFIQQVLTKALSEMGYEAPQDLVNKLIARVTPVSSRASSRASSCTASPIKTTKNQNKRQASSSSSDEGTTCSDSTVVGSDMLKKAKTTRGQPEMDIDPSPAPTTCANDAQPQNGPNNSDYDRQGLHN
ncbi:hypothetical protein EVAR_90294_1 [Eumeta japonica]|uniref:Uncharacterized protein n=1 Tax=Eumeta variegata TaxID=151549 RepID=A0A4C1Z898_EUMVA|nr:hypothetical protein EVAR_90294_1 [Eumeta japonica]